MEMRREQLRFDSSCHSPDDIQRAAYRFIDRFAATVGQTGRWIQCDIEFEPRHLASADATLRAFRKEVLDQTLRARIKRETEPVRNLILAHAFSRTGLTSQNG